MYNTTIEQNTNMVRFFSRELYRGTITMQQLTHLQQAGANTPEGFQALIASEMLGSEGGVGDILRDTGATNPMSAARALRAMLQGSLVEGGAIRDPETEAEKEIAAGRKETIEREMGDWVKRNAERMAGPGGAAMDINSFIRKLSEMLGIVSSGDTEAAGESIFGAFTKDFTLNIAEQKSSSEMMSGAAKDILNAAKLEKAGQDLLDERMSAHEEVWQAIRGGFQESVRAFDMAVGIYTGRDTKGLTEEMTEETKTAMETGTMGRWWLKSLVGTLVGILPEEKLTLAEESMKQDAMKRRYELYKETRNANYLRVQVVDNTENKPVDIEVDKAINLYNLF